MTHVRPRTLVAMHRHVARWLLDEDARARLVSVADTDPDLVVEDFTTASARAALAEVEVLFTGWGCPPVDEQVLRDAPRLRAVVHAAGSVKHHVTDACWRRGIAVSSAAAANALPVAEYTLAAILMSNKRVPAIAARYREAREPQDWQAQFPWLGNYRRRVGVVGASKIGRRVVELLRPFDLDVVVADPYLTAAEAASLGVALVGLDDLVRTSHVVSLHAPELPETRHLMDARRLALMPTGATLINTSRGSLVDTAALLRELFAERLHAVLDVTDPDVPPADSPLFTAPNLVLTPHIAGSLGNELTRMTAQALDELDRLGRGLPLSHRVLPEVLDRSA
ncbi:hydroxyacid dehydrogenase [Saccharothrix sp. NPDC042600]|uniref:hydroxyacid dehydrogenase n=1 Tax=Saccharothrix TaxID=2071 RepID=UPI003406418D|nr:hydroxyacid dehydrogenase [Saccharothrix mutabilis subsp. capreolus]